MEVTKDVAQLEQKINTLKEMIVDLRVKNISQGIKGDITDLVFETIAEVRVKSQEYLNNIEAWWIRKFIHDCGKEHVMNITIPKITIQELAAEYDKIVEGQRKKQRLR